MENKKIDYTRLKAAISDKGMSLSQASAGMGYSVKSLQQAGMRGMISAPMLHSLGATYGILYEDIRPEEAPNTAEELNRVRSALRVAEAALREMERTLHE